VEDRGPGAAVGAPRVRRTPPGDGVAEAAPSGEVGFRLRARGSLRDPGPLRTGTDRDPVPHGARVPLCGATQRVPER